MSLELYGIAFYCAGRNYSFTQNTPDLAHVPCNFVSIFQSGVVRWDAVMHTYDRLLI